MDEKLRKKVEQLEAKDPPENITLGKNLASTLKGTKLDKVKEHILTTMDYFDSKMEFEAAKWGYKKVSEWYDELDRCYNVEGQPKKDRMYKGNSNFVTNDYHDAIIKIKNRYKQVFSGKTKKFTAIVSNEEKNLENAEFGKYLVKHSMNLARLDTKTDDTYYTLANYGHAIVHDPLRVIENYHPEINDNVIDKEGAAAFWMGEPLREKPSWKDVSSIAVFTDWIPTDIRDLKVDPSLADIKRQYAIFRRLKFTWPELIGLEEAGDIVNIKEYKDEQDHAGRWIDSTTADEDKEDSSNLKPRTITECYFLFENLTDKKKGLTKYIAIMGNDSRLLSLKECIYSTWPFFNAVYETTKKMKLLGLGAGQIIYPSFLGLCTRLNQGFDKRTSEIIPGGFKDPMVPSLDDYVPGEFKNVPGLATFPGKAVQTMNQLMGTTSQLDRIDIDLMKANIQSAVPALLGGSPTGTPADRTKGGLEMLLNQAQSLMDTNLLHTETQLDGSYATDCYNNYVTFFKALYDDPEDIKKTLTEWLGSAKMSYTDPKTKEKKVIDFPTAWPPCHFIFGGARAAIDKIEALTRLEQMFGIMTKIGQSGPEAAQLMSMYLAKIDYEVVMKDVFIALDIGDIDKYFPEFNALVELTKMQKALTQCQQESQTSKEMLFRIASKVLELATTKTTAEPASPEGQAQLRVQQVGLDLKKFIDDNFEQLKDQSADNKNK